MEFLSNLAVKDIKRSDLSIDYLNDITIEDDKKNSLIESFNYYLEKDQINDKNLDIDVLKIQKYLNMITELQNPPSLCNEINDLQRKNLADLFNHIQHFKRFIKEFLNKNDYDNICMKKIRITVINLELFYIHQRKVIIGNETFRKAIDKKKKD
ncbi:11328_t:CDS:1 [Dentiscutata heterogama]|uniref:11328_t:CDS:1 n=1 Tax=Dentiscutata heterogama TaxID=1316150 RepID=A0ACA9LAP3_9GLOM|nr:11328_t:CDS:1 [Dentiscutata heterogama]